DKLDAIYIPLLCTYSCDLFTKYDDENSTEFIDEYEEKIRALKNYFDGKNKHPLKSKLQIIVVLLPVKCKKTLVKKLHKKLSLMQALGE
ncbi:MAG: Hachiman antiphage defense system protein HamA, partial [Methanobacterium sp.]